MLFGMSLRPLDFTWLTLGPLILAVMTLLWALQLKSKNATSVDLAWSGGLGITTLILAGVAEGSSQRRILISAMVAFWAVRLSLLLFRRVRAGEEDRRYAALRKQWKPSHFLFFYWGQGALVWLLPVVHLGSLEGIGVFPSFWDLFFSAVWALSLWGESVADHQLEVFKKSASRNSICRVGWWSVSRHPNYFFESLQWVSWGAIAASAGMASDRPWLSLALAVAAPGVVILSIFRVTGIPATEEHMLSTRGDAYRKLMREVPTIFPNPVAVFKMFFAKTKARG